MSATAFKSVKNNAESRVASGALNNTTSPLTFSVSTGQGGRFPSIGSFWVTVYDDATYSDPRDDPNMRIGLCTLRSGDTLTVTWGEDGTPINAITGTPKIAIFLQSMNLSEVHAAVNALENRTISPGTGLSGGGDLSANRTLSLLGATSSVIGGIQLTGDLGGSSSSPVVKSRAVSATVGPNGDFTSVQSALDFVGGNGGGTVKLLFAGSPYTISSSWLVWANTTLEAEPGVTITQANGSNLFRLIKNKNFGTTGDDRITLRSLKIDGNGANQTTTSLGINIQQGNELRLQDVEVVNCRDEGIYLKNITGVYVSSIYTHSNGRDGIVFDTCTSVKGGSVRANSNGTGGSRSGIYLANCSDVDLVAVQADSNPYHGIDCSGTTGGNIRVSGTANSNGRFGVYCGYGAAGAGVGPINCRFYVDTSGNSFGGHGYEQTTDIHGFGISNGDAYGAYFDTCSNCSFSGTVKLAQKNGVHLAGSDHCFVDLDYAFNNGQLTNATYSDVSIQANTGSIHNAANSVNNTVKVGVSQATATNKVTAAISTSSSSQSGNTLWVGVVDGPINKIVISGNGTSQHRNQVISGGGVNPIGHYPLGNLTGTFNTDRVNGDVQSGTLTGNLTLTINNGQISGDRLRFILTQDATGGRTVAFGGSNIILTGFSAYTMPAAIGAVDVIDMVWDKGVTKWRILPPVSMGGLGGSVTAVSVVSANGFTGSVSNASSTPAITVATSITGLLKGNGTAISAATPGTDYLTPSGNGSALTGITGSQISGNISGNAANVTGTVAIANGGTGQTTATGGFNALSPMSALGDIIYGGSSGVGTRLAGNTTTTKKFLAQTGDGTNSVAPAWGTLAAGDVPNLESLNTSGGLTVAKGGTGVVTLTGLVKGNGTSAFSAAVAGTDYLTPSGDGSSLTGITASQISGAYSSYVEITGNASAPSAPSVTGYIRIYPAGTGASNNLAFINNGGVANTIVSDVNTLSLSNKTLVTPRVDQLNDTNGNASLVLSPTASAVNQVTITNAATGSHPSISASGTDANVNLVLVSKGTGQVQIKPGTNSNVAVKILNASGGTTVLQVDTSNTRVGIGNVTPTSTLHVNGPIATAYVAKTGAYTVTAADSTIDCTSGTFTVTLPTAVSITGRMYTIKNSGAGTITIATTSSQTIDGASTASLSVQYKAVTVQSDGSNWKVIGQV